MNFHPLVNSFSHPVLKNMGLNSHEPLIIAGPCAVESYESLIKTALELKELGVKYLRAGAFKPRTSIYDFQGLQCEGLAILKQIKKETGLKIVTEIPSVEFIDQFVNDVDIIQVGARNMQNFPLLLALGKINKPVMLKRGFGNTLEEWLCAAEYILAGGNNNLILCERGIKTFENATRNTLDLASVAIIKATTKIPVIVDPSHACGRSDIVIPLAKAGLAAGADGLLIEVHYDPLQALSDGAQAITIEQFKTLLKSI